MRTMFIKSTEKYKSQETQGYDNYRQNCKNQRPVCKRSYYKYIQSEIPWSSVDSVSKSTAIWFYCTCQYFLWNIIYIVTKWKHEISKH